MLPGMLRFDRQARASRGFLLRALTRPLPGSGFGLVSERELEPTPPPVCIENLIRFDCVAEPHNVSANGRAPCCST
jgi:hypothetical protein